MNKPEIKCIIVEGPDNSGKDTACEQLKALILNRLHRYPVYISPKFSKLTEDWPGEMRRLKKFTEDFIDNMSDEYILILNRSWFDEDVYGPLYRNYAPEDTEWLYDLSHARKSRIAYVSLDDSTDRLAAREDGKSFSAGLKSAIASEREKFIGVFTKIVNMNIRNQFVNVSKVRPEDMGENIFRHFWP